MKQTPAEFAAKAGRDDSLTDLRRLLTNERRETARLREVTAEYEHRLEELSAVQEFLDYEPSPKYAIEKLAKGCKRTDRQEAVAVSIASDWHVEETVTRAQTNGFNAYNLRIAEERIDRYFRGLVRMIWISRNRNDKRNEVHITRCVIALIGDIINGYLRDENLIGNSLTPPKAIVWVFHRIARGLEYVREQADLENIHVVCRSGNHGRLMTISERKVMWGEKESMSLEHILFAMLAARFDGDKVITFDVPEEGIYSEVNILGYLYRFFHGDNVKFMGGVGGLSVPLNKLTMRLNQRRPAYRHVLGHFHSTHWLPNANVNGCFAADTRVITPLGPVPISEVVVGAKVLSRDGTIQTVEATTSKETRDIVRLRVKGLPNFVRCTPNHQFWAVKGETQTTKRGRAGGGCKPTILNEKPQWVQAAYLSEGDWVCTPVLNGNGERDRGLLWAYGLFMAEGHTIVDGGATRRHNRLEYSMHINEQPILQRAKEILDKHFGKPGRIWTRPLKTTSHLSYSGRDVAVKFREEFGHKSYGKQVPSWMFDLSVECRSAVVRGWVDGDGHYGRQKSAATTSEKLAWSMWMLSIGTEWEPMLYQSVSRLKATEKGRAEAWALSFVGTQDVRWIDGERFLRVDYRGRETLEQDEVVHDLQVSGEHTYCVEGIGVHNSLIGMDPYAMALGFDLEIPQQSYWIVRRNRGQDGMTSIFCDRD